MERDSVGQVLILHIQHFLFSCFSSYNTNNPNPYAHSEIMMHTPSTDTQKWRENISQDYFCPSKKLQTRKYHQQMILYNPWNSYSWSKLVSNLPAKQTERKSDLTIPLQHPVVWALQPLIKNLFFKCAEKQPVVHLTVYQHGSNNVGKKSDQSNTKWP